MNNSEHDNNVVKSVIWTISDLIYQQVIPGNHVSTNNAYANIPKRGRCLTRRGRALKKMVSELVRLTYKGPILEDPLDMSIRYVFCDRRQRDVNNFDKLIVDACHNIIFKNDLQIQRMFLEKYVDKKNGPYTEIMVFKKKNLADPKSVPATKINAIQTHS